MLEVRALLALGLLSYAAACGPDENKEPRDAGGSDADSDAGTPLRFEAFDTALEAAIASWNQAHPSAPIAGGASAVVVDRERGLVHQKGYLGFAADRLYLIASASKILSAGVLLRLADQAKLDLDAPIANYLSGEWGAHKAGVTAAQLISNSSGLPSLDEVSSSLLPGGDATPYVPHFCQFREGPITLAECGKAIYDDDNPGNNRPPDQLFRYGGSQWQLAGALAEKVGGKPWAELVTETYAACNVPSLGYTNPFQRSPGRYLNFEANEENLPVTANPSIEGGAYVNAPDYGRILWMLLRGGRCGESRVLSEAMVARMQRDRVGGPSGYAPTVGTGSNLQGVPYTIPGYGLGMWVDTPRGFVASPGAYGAYPWIDQARGYAAIIVIEATNEAGIALADATRPVLNGIFDAR